VLDLIPNDAYMGFSKSFSMLRDVCPSTGILPKGYWCDVGTMEEYRLRQRPIYLYGKVKKAGRTHWHHLGGGIWRQTKA